MAVTLLDPMTRGLKDSGFVQLFDIHHAVTLLDPMTRGLKVLA